MPYRVRKDGLIECDTAAEALALAGQVEPVEVMDAKSRDDKRTTQAASGSRWNEERLSKFHRLLQGRPKKILEILWEHQSGLTDGQLLKEFGWGADAGRKLAGVLSGLAKRVKGAGLDPRELYEKTPLQISGERVYEYRLTQTYRNARATGLSKKEGGDSASL